MNLMILANINCHDFNLAGMIKDDFCIYLSGLPRSQYMYYLDIDFFSRQKYIFRKEKMSLDLFVTKFNVESLIIMMTLSRVKTIENER